MAAYGRDMSITMAPEDTEDGLFASGILLSDNAGIVAASLVFCAIGWSARSKLTLRSHWTLEAWATY